MTQQEEGGEESFRLPQKLNTAGPVLNGFTWADRSGFSSSPAWTAAGLDPRAATELCCFTGEGTNQQTHHPAGDNTEQPDR